MAQTTNSLGKRLYDGEFIDLTAEKEAQNVLNEDDDILILDTSKPMEHLTAEINKKLKSQNQTTKSNVPAVQRKVLKSYGNLVSYGPSRVRDTDAQKTITKNQTTLMNVKPPTEGISLAKTQLNEKSAVTNTQQKEIISKTGNFVNLVAKGPIRNLSQISEAVNTTVTAVVNRPTFVTVQSSVAGSDLAHKQLIDSLSQHLLKTTNSKNVYALSKGYAAKIDALRKSQPVKIVAVGTPSNTSGESEKVGNPQSATPIKPSNTFGESGKVVNPQSGTPIKPSNTFQGSAKAGNPQAASSIKPSNTGESAKIANLQSATLVKPSNTFKGNDAITGVSDIVLTPSSSEIRNKKFPKDPLSQNTTDNDDDVIFVNSKMMSKPSPKPANAGLQKIFNPASKSPIGQKTILNKLFTASSKVAIPLSERAKMLQDARAKPTPTLESRPGCASSDKNKTVVSQGVIKNNAQSMNVGKNNLVLNGLCTKKFLKKAQPSQMVPTNAFQQKPSVSQLSMKNALSKNTVKVHDKKTPIRPLGPQTIIRNVQQMNASNTSGDDGIICLSEVEDKLRQNQNFIMLPTSDGLIKFKVKSKKISSYDDIEDDIPANMVQNPVLKQKTTVEQALRNLIAEVTDGNESGLPDKPTIVDKSILSSHNMADIVETASAVANITPNDNEILANTSKTGQSILYLLYPINSETGELSALKEGQINQVLALVPSDSLLAPSGSLLAPPDSLLAPPDSLLAPLGAPAPPGSLLTPSRLVPVCQDEKGQPECIISESVKEVEQEYTIIPNDPVSNGNVLFQTKPKKKMKIETLPKVTPVDIMQIINQGKKREISGRCKNLEVYSGVYLKGFNRMRPPSCAKELRTILKKEERKLDQMEMALRYYESNFVVCGSATNYYLPETVKTEAEECEEVTVECYTLDQTEDLPTISQVISKVNAEVFQMRNQEQTRNKGVKDNLPNPSRTEEALKLIRQGLEMIQNWSQESSGSPEKTKEMKKTKRRRIGTKVNEKDNETHTPVYMKPPRGKASEAHDSLPKPVRGKAGGAKLVHAKGGGGQSSLGAKPAQKVSAPNNSVPEIKKRGRRKKVTNEDVILIEDVPEPPPVKKRRKKEIENVTAVNITNIKRKKSNMGANKVNSRKNMGTNDNSDDLLVVKRVDIINNGKTTRGRKRKQLL